MTEYEQRCTWCGLTRDECHCNSPRFKRHSKCEVCDKWTPVDELCLAGVEEPENHFSCRGCLT